MRTLISTLVCTVLCLCIGYSQINTNANTGYSLGGKTGIVTKAVPLKRIAQKVFKDQKLSQLRKSSILKMEVPKSYLSRPTQKSWKITPGRAFGRSNLGYTLWSGQLWRNEFLVERRFLGREPMTWVSMLEFPATKNKTYLIRINSRGCSSNRYIYMAASPTLKVHGSNGSYVALVEAEETGTLRLGISAMHTVGGNERYAETLVIQSIEIDELKS